MKFKLLRVIVTAVFLIILCACSQQAAAPADTAGAPTSENVSAPVEAVPDVDVTYLLSYIAESGRQLESFPALIKGADIEKDGCVLHLDRLEINPNFEPGGQGDELYLLNESEEVEEIKALDLAYAEYNAKTSEIGPEFLNYISGDEDGVEFTVFMLGDEVIFLSEITVP